MEKANGTCKNCGEKYFGYGKEFCSIQCVGKYWDGKTKKDLSSRFWSKVKKSDNCWEWIGAINSGGYGSFYKGIDNKGKKKIVSAPRISWEIHFGEIPNGLHVLHRCDVRLCVNPLHLFLGTNLDNQRDKASKGRGRTRSIYGVKHHNSKLNRAYVRIIKEMLAFGYPHRKIAKEFNVCRAHIGSIANERVWVNI